MGAFNDLRAFDPLDLEILDRVFEAAWAQVEAQQPSRDRAEDDELKQELRKRIFRFAGRGGVDFDELCDRLAARPERFTPIVTKKGTSGSDGDLI